MKCTTLCACSTLLIAALSAQQKIAPFVPHIPKTWDDQALRDIQIPPAGLTGVVSHPPADYYYRIPARTVFRSYPVYRPGKEPPGYFEWLKEQEPEVASDPSKLKTEADWIRAGELMLRQPF